MTLLRVLVIVACFAVVRGGNVTIRVDDEVQIYLDGQVVYDEFDIPRWQWKELVEIPFSDDARIMAFRMYNQGPRRLGYGKGKIDGKDLFSSGIVCIDVPKRQDPDAVFPGWFENDYNDSEWRPPVAVVSHPTEGILADAQGFWGGPRSSKTVLCRLKLNIDECAEGTSGCLHKCENLEGSVKCSCKEGFDLAEDGKNCTAVVTPLEAANCGDIKWIDNSTLEVNSSPNLKGWCRHFMHALENDDASYTLSVEFKFNLAGAGLMWNWHDSNNYDMIYIMYSSSGYLCDIRTMVNGSMKILHFVIVKSSLPDWTSVVVEVTPDDDAPTILLNGNTVESRPGKHSTKAAWGVGVFNGMAGVTAFFRNFHME